MVDSRRYCGTISWERNEEWLMDGHFGKRRCTLIQNNQAKKPGEISGSVQKEMALNQKHRWWIMKLTKVPVLSPKRGMTLGKRIESRSMGLERIFSLTLVCFFLFLHPCCWGRLCRLLAAAAAGISYCLCWCFCRDNGTFTSISFQYWMSLKWLAPMLFLSRRPEIEKKVLRDLLSLSPVFVCFPLWLETRDWFLSDYQNTCQKRQIFHQPQSFQWSTAEFLTCKKWLHDLQYCLIIQVLAF